MKTETFNEKAKGMENNKGIIGTLFVLALFVVFITVVFSPDFIPRTVYLLCKYFLIFIGILIAAFVAVIFILLILCVICDI